MSAESSHTAVDAWYDLYTTAVADLDFLEQLIAPSIQRFQVAGYQSAIVTEKKHNDYYLHVFAIQNTAAAPAVAVSEKAREISDHHQLSHVTESAHEPNQVSFF